MRASDETGRLTRRRLFATGAAALATPMAGAQTIAPPVPGAPDDEAARIAASNDAARHLTIPVMVNGAGPYRFVVDTGADRTVIADDIAAELGLLRGHMVTVQGVVRSLNSKLVQVAEISFGTVQRRNLSMPTLPRSLMGADGYLGLDVVDGSRVSLDFRNHALEVSRSVHPNPFSLSHAVEAYVPLRGTMGHLRSINCRVDGISTTSFIDTGAEISCGNTHLLLALLNANPDYPVLGTIPITGITGGAIMARVVSASNIRLHSVNFSDAVIAIADMEVFDVWGLSNEPALLIGMNFLRQFARVSIDYGLKELRFDLASMLLARRG